MGGPLFELAIDGGGGGGGGGPKDGFFDWGGGGGGGGGDVVIVALGGDGGSGSGAEDTGVGRCDAAAGFDIVTVVEVFFVFSGFCGVVETGLLLICKGPRESILGTIFISVTFLPSFGPTFLNLKCFTSSAAFDSLASAEETVEFALTLHGTEADGNGLGGPSFTHGGRNVVL